MAYHLNNIAPIRSVPKQIEARFYNRVRLALIRLQNPLRISLHTDLGQTDMLLSDDEWLCVDRAHDDLPLIAWTDFQGKRTGLHDPIRCTLHIYHSHAGLLMSSALPVLDRILERRLTENN